MQTARCFIIAIVFCLVSGDPIVIDQTSEKYQTICTKQNTEFKQLCTPQPTCSEPAWVPSKCIEGCLCKDGFVLNPMGDCIPPETCPGVICPQNTTFSMCANVCEKNCMTQYLTPEYACRCSPGCECLEGFVRDRTSFCIRPEDCDPEIVKCPENQVYNKCKSSVDTCTGPILYKKCTSGCFCEDGWVLDDNNNCVLKENCPKQEIEEQDCPRNQTFKDCSLCGRSCETQYINIMFKCACQPGCACQDGYIWKNNNEKQCVKPDDCTREDTKCQSTQYYSDSEVRKTCLKPSGNGIKTSGCFCNDGLVYDEDTRTCMKPEKCPNAQCGSRQSYHECYKNIVRTCQDKQVEKVRDIESIECLSGCFCDGPFIWDAETQKCVYPTECQNSKENQICSKDDPKSEFRVCQSSTKATCTDPNPLAINKDCRSECRCKEGYVFNEKTEKCMTLEDCVDHKSSMSSCDSNSTYSVCASACPKTCANAYGNKMALATCMACYEGCECKPNYLRTKDKRCVLIKDCPEQEILCPSDRQYKSCEHVIKTCSTNITNEDTCLRGCFCRDDMVQNANGRCIYPGECTNSSENRKCQKSDVNSHYEECQYVRRSCSDPNGANRREKCRKGCVCNDGYVYYKKLNRCVTPSTCNS